MKLCRSCFLDADKNLNAKAGKCWPFLEHASVQRPMCLFCCNVHSGKQGRVLPKMNEYLIGLFVGEVCGCIVASVGSQTQKFSERAEKCPGGQATHSQSGEEQSGTKKTLQTQHSRNWMRTINTRIRSRMYGSDLRPHLPTQKHKRKNTQNSCKNNKESHMLRCKACQCLPRRGRWLMKLFARTGEQARSICEGTQIEHALQMQTGRRFIQNMAKIHGRNRARSIAKGTHRPDSQPNRVCPGNSRPR